VDTCGIHAIARFHFSTKYEPARQQQNSQLAFWIAPRRSGKYDRHDCLLSRPGRESRLSGLHEGDGPMLSEAELKRLRWQCTHRAQRELDLLLGSFLDRRFPELDPERQAAFAALAEMEDVDLWPLVVGRRECLDSARKEILAMLRKAGTDREKGARGPL
jgi:succinate dehydrogenase flavin-adding protein (antitoxin of CptAB toxin-antitoxin module)